MRRRAVFHGAISRVWHTEQVRMETCMAGGVDGVVCGGGRWMGVWVGRQVDGRMYEWVDGWVDGWRD